MRLFLEFEKGLVDRRYEKTIIPIDKKKLIYISDLYSFISREFKCKGLFVIKWKNYYIPPKFKIQDILSDNHIIQICEDENDLTSESSIDSSNEGPVVADSPSSNPIITLPKKRQKMRERGIPGKEKREIEKRRKIVESKKQNEINDEENMERRYSSIVSSSSNTSPAKKNKAAKKTVSNQIIKRVKKYSTRPENIQEIEENKSRIKNSRTKLGVMETITSEDESSSSSDSNSSSEDIIIPKAQSKLKKPMPKDTRNIVSTVPTSTLLKSKSKNVLGLKIKSPQEEYIEKQRQWEGVNSQIEKKTEQKSKGRKHVIVENNELVKKWTQIT